MTQRQRKVINRSRRIYQSALAEATEMAHQITEQAAGFTKDSYVVFLACGIVQNAVMLHVIADAQIPTEPAKRRRKQ